MGLRFSRVVPPLGVAVLTSVMALIPALRDQRFYLTDDSAAQFLPSWYHLGELLRSGQFPLLDPTLWAGGNIAAEALFGIWNPVLLATMVFVSLVPNLVVASVVVKTFFLVLLALGVYGLVPRVRGAARALGRRRRHRALRRRDALLRRRVVVVRPDGVRVRALVLVDAAAQCARGADPDRPVRRRLPRDDGRQPVRRAGCLPGRGGRSPWSSRWTKRWAPVRRTLLGGIAVGLVAPLTYLPLVLTQSVTYRSESKIGNSGLMVPGLGDLLNASTPSFAAWVDAFEKPYLTVPATYLAWYALPLLPWLRYRAIVERVRVADGRPRLHGDRPGVLGRPVRGVDVPVAAAGGALLRAAGGRPARDRARPGTCGRPPAPACRRVGADHSGRRLPGRGQPDRTSCTPTWRRSCSSGSLTAAVVAAWLRWPAPPRRVRGAARRDAWPCSRSRSPCSRATPT